MNIPCPLVPAKIVEPLCITVEILPEYIPIVCTHCALAKLIVKIAANNMIIFSC